MDLVIGAPGYTHPNSSIPQTGAIFIIPGTTLAHHNLTQTLTKADTPNLNIPTTIPIELLASVTIHGDPLEEGSRFGTSMAVVDLNEDGIDDLVVSAPQFNSIDLFYDGRVYVFFGFSGVGIRSRWSREGKMRVGEGDVPAVPGDDDDGGDESVNIRDDSMSQREGDAVASASLVIEAPQRRPRHVPGTPYSFLFTVLGSHLASVDLDGNGHGDLIIGSPHAHTGNGGGWWGSGVAQKGLVHAIIASNETFVSGFGVDDDVRRMNLSDVVSWSMDSGDWIDYQLFGSSIGFWPFKKDGGGEGTGSVNESNSVKNNGEFRPGILLVGAPGWRKARKIRVSDFENSGDLLAAISSPTETSSLARAKFMDLPGLLTTAHSHGYSSGKIRFINITEIESGDWALDDLDSVDSFGHVGDRNRGGGGSLDRFRTAGGTVSPKAVLYGSRSNGRLGGGGLWVDEVVNETGNGKEGNGGGLGMWVAEPLVDGESGRVYQIFTDRVFESTTNDNHPIKKSITSAARLSKSSDGGKYRCMCGDSVMERFGTQVGGIKVGSNGKDSSVEYMVVGSGGDLDVLERKVQRGLQSGGGGGYDGSKLFGRRSGIVRLVRVSS
ncbi:Glycosylphosphatidylinositol specific phospholipase D1 [Blyttiomyces sp. JEL0837]|nr:Glycosylphosphatidylinositol specific phospholipase D1 [Blyttiomyces sp. JEL0837]